MLNVIKKTRYCIVETRPFLNMWRQNVESLNTCLYK